MRNFFYKRLTAVLTEIKLTENGFSIIQPFRAKPIIYDWKNIKNIQFSEDKNEVLLEHFKNQIILKNIFTGWYEFIQNVPKEFVNFDFDYVVNLIDSLKACGVCGIVAVKENVCIVCETTQWNSNNSLTETEFFKLKQSEFFAILLKDGREIKKQPEPEHGFKANKNWKLYI